MDFSNRIALIAGATGNLGEAVARRLDEGGASIALVDRSMGRLERVFPNLLASDRHLLVECTDMNRPDLVDAAVSEINARYGRIDIFVSGVGGYRAGMALHNTPIETFDFLLMLNARTLYVGAQAVIPIMLEHGYGRIIGIGARPGLMGAPQAAAYSASKAATIRLIESMAEELKHAGITANTVLPGTMDTPENRADNPDEDYSRWVSLESVADVIAFLASEAARDINGASIPVYGRS